MRFDKQIIYPHPVLRREGFDYERSEFFAGISCTPSPDADGPLVIVSDYRLNCPAIEALVANGSASVTMQVKCRSTCLNELVNFVRGQARLELSPSQIHGTIEIATVIRASRDITAFGSDDFADDFRGVTFDLNEGALLAFAAPVQLYVDREAFGSAESVIDLVQSDAVEDCMWEVDTEHDRLRILVGRSMMETLTTHRGYELGRAILTASIYSGAVQQAVQALKEGDDGHLWQRVFRQRCALNEIDLRSCDSATVAQLLLKFPLLPVFDKLKESRDAD